MTTVEPIVVTPMPRPVIRSSFTGLVTDSYDSDWVATVLVGGVDVIEALADDLAALDSPVRGTFKVGADVYQASDLYFDVGSVGGECSCCSGGPEQPTIQLAGWGSADLYPLLVSLDGQSIELSWRLVGYVPPMVTATLAHHTRYGRPGDRITLPLPEMRKLATSKLIAAHAEQVRALR